MFLVRVPPEDVRLQIAAGKIKEQQTVVVIVDGIFEQGQPFLQDFVRLLDEFIVVEDAVLAGVSSLLENRWCKTGPAYRELPARTSPARKSCTAGIGRVDIDGRHIKLTIGRDFLQIKAADAARLRARA